MTEDEALNEALGPLLRFIDRIVLEATAHLDKINALEKVDGMSIKEITDAIKFGTFNIHEAKGETDTSKKPKSCSECKDFIPLTFNNFVGDYVADKWIWFEFICLDQMRHFEGSFDPSSGRPECCRFGGAGYES